MPNPFDEEVKKYVKEIIKIIKNASLIDDDLNKDEIQRKFIENLDNKEVFSPAIFRAAMREVADNINILIEKRYRYVVLQS
ncbi:MAG: hypothetical protein ABH956_00020 [Candidatus Nealsonbacteria bacterium]